MQVPQVAALAPERAPQTRRQAIYNQQQNLDEARAAVT